MGDLLRPKSRPGTERSLLGRVFGLEFGRIWSLETSRVKVPPPTRPRKPTPNSVRLRGARFR